MRFLHTMVRVSDLDASLAFYCGKLGLAEIRRMDSRQGRFTLVFLAAPDDSARAKAERAPLIELTYNWDAEDYGSGRNFGHLAFEVDDIYAFCQKLSDEASSSTGRPVTAAWRSCARLTRFRSRFCRKGPPCPRGSRGPPWPIPGPGSGRAIMAFQEPASWQNFSL